MTSSSSSDINTFLDSSTNEKPIFLASHIVFRNPPRNHRALNALSALLFVGGICNERYST
jgi:hypothetical protein